MPDVETVALRTVFLHVTRACNLRCAYCYCSAGTTAPDELREEEFTALWPQLVALGPEKVVFTGGEPLVRRDLLDLLAGLRTADPTHSVRRCLNTNGHLVTPQLADALVGLTDEVRVSIDGLAATNDAVRGGGNFAAALGALESLHARGFEPKALITVTSRTLPDLEALLCLLHDRGITQVNVNAFRPIGRGRTHADWVADPAAVHSALERAWARCHPDWGPFPTARESAATGSCGVGRFLNVTPDGDVYPCHVLTEPQFRLGNVREVALTALCRRDGPLGRLQAFDQRTFSPPGTEPGAAGHVECLGDLISRFPSASDAIAACVGPPNATRVELRLPSGVRV
jgi:MoaA/NifB/PqqE/SkfB family radical SAM enzyme